MIILCLDVRDERIYNNVRFSKADENNITITDLTLEDHMCIQCNATNKHAYVFADVFLNVLGKSGLLHIGFNLIAAQCTYFFQNYYEKFLVKYAPNKDIL